MNITSIARAEQLIPISQARTNLPALIEAVSENDFFVLVKKYQPKAALVNLDFLEKLLDIYHNWRKQQDWAALDNLRDSLPTNNSSVIERDITHALQAIRKAD